MTKLKNRPRAGLIGIALMLLCPQVLAVNFLVDGEVTMCAAIACNAAGIAVGDQISGFVAVDDAAAVPNSTITETDVTGFELNVGDLMSSGTDGSLADAALMTDGDGEIVAGMASIDTTVDTPLGTADVEISLDAASGTWAATTTFLGLGEIASGTLAFTREVVADPDSDGDGVTDMFDNCIEVVNPDQRDTDGDLYGNACDADLNNDGAINVIDLGLLRTVFFTDDADADFNGDGVVSVIDLGIMRVSFFGVPGPSGLVSP